MPKLTRRKLIVGGLIGGAFAVGYAIIPPRPDWNGPLASDEHLFNNWVKIGPDGTISVYVAQAEMGQGIFSGFASLIAEEMDADWSRVSVYPAPDHPSYSNITFATVAIPFVGSLPSFMKPTGTWLIKEVLDRTGLIATGGSTSMVDKYQRLREAGALARMTLVQAAADIWDVSTDDCDVSNSVVRHTPTGKALDFADLVNQAAETEISGDLVLKPASKFNLVGKETTQRLDIPAKVTGEAIFGADIRLDDMVYAAVLNGGSSMGRITDVDVASVRQRSGVIDVVRTETWVAVVAKTQWHAQSAIDALDVTWDRGDGALMTDGWQEKRIYNASQASAPGTMIEENASVETVFADAADVLTATYSVPYLAHACLETNNATAHWTDEGLEIWAPNQSPTIIKMGLTAAYDIENANITVHSTLLGGGFGRKVEPDVSVQAAHISREVGRPVQVIWSRKEDIHADVFRPPAAATMVAALDADSKVIALKTHVASQSVGASFQGRWFGGSGNYEGRDPATVEGLEELPYDFGAYQLGYTDNKAAATLGFWRSVGHSYTAYFAEAFADELAVKAGEDPLAFRLSRMTEPRARKVLQTAADLAGYGAVLPEGRYQGVAFHESFGSMAAMVVEIDPAQGDGFLPRVTRVFAAVDCGIAVNPDSIRSQMEGSIVFGLTAALYGELNFENGIPVETNFDGYPLLSMAEAPETQISILSSDAPIGGVGEPGVPPVAPALANAIFKWRGSPVRSLPMIKHLDMGNSGNTIASAASL